MAKFPALPLWTDAYLADTLDLETADHGLYIIMMMIAWRRHDCALPDDMKWLKRALQSAAADLHGHTFNARVPRILKRFWTFEPAGPGDDGVGKWVQKRLQKEFKYLSNRAQKNSKAAHKRWKNKDLGDATAYAPTPTPIKDIDPNGSIVLSPAAKPPQPDIAVLMVDIWREVCVPTLSDVRKITTTRRQKLLRRLKEDFGGEVEQWRAFCRRIMGSEHLTGGNGRGWKADLDWVIEPQKCLRILEGRYDRGPRQQAAQGSWL